MSQPLNQEVGSSQTAGPGLHTVLAGIQNLTPDSVTGLVKMTVPMLITIIDDQEGRLEKLKAEVAELKIRVDIHEKSSDILQSAVNTQIDET